MSDTDEVPDEPVEFNFQSLDMKLLRLHARRLRAMLRRFSDPRPNDCVKFGRHEICSPGADCAYRAADDAIAAYSAVDKNAGPE